MTACPLCAAPWSDGQTTCACGYDVILVDTIEQDRKSWRATRNVFGVMALAGIAFTILFPTLAVSAGFATIGVVGGVWSATKVRATNRRLRDAAEPKQLPAARAMQLPARKEP